MENKNDGIQSNCHKILKLGNSVEERKSKRYTLDVLCSDAVFYIRRTCFLMIALITLYDGYNDRPILTEQKTSRAYRSSHAIVHDCTIRKSFGKPVQPRSNLTTSKFIWGLSHHSPPRNYSPHCGKITMIGGGLYVI